MSEADEALGARLDRGASALQLSLDPHQRHQLLAYLALLVRWNRVYNLTAVREPTAMVDQHLLDCLAVVNPLRRQLRGRPARVLDVGSGAGLPGLVLAIAMPETEVTCVDAVGKKAIFIRQAAAELGLDRVVALHTRMEALRIPPSDVMTSRAFSSLGEFVAPTARLLTKDGVWVAMKGKSPLDEIAALDEGVEVFHVEQLPASIGERCLVWMRTRQPD